METASKILIYLIFIFSAPLFIGIVNKLKARFTGRIGPSIFQSYYDLGRLLRKETIYADSASFISRIAPVISFVSILFAGMILPIGFTRPLISFNGDIILFAYLLGLSRFFQILGAMDIGSSFEGMGAAREATFAVFAEPIYFFTLGSLAFIFNRTSMFDIFHSITLSDPSFFVFIIVASISVFFLMITETSRMPVDDPNTHLELTMIHEVMILDNSGTDLFLYQYSAYLKILIYATFTSNFFNPFNAQNYVYGFLVYLLVMLLLILCLVWVETMLARFRMKSIPQYLLFAASIGVLNLLIYSFFRK
ncbi:MAG: respiratory chain complex I subunit 1 family protein [Ignavibacteriales bacterium]